MTTHRSALVLILVAAIAATSGTPTLAGRNTGSHIDSIEFNNAGGVCDVSLDVFSDATNKMKDAKTKKARNEARDDANWAINKGVEGGCIWVLGV